jgi:hypothetical protein
LLVLVAGAVMLNVLAYNHARAMTHFVVGGRRTVEPERLSPLAKCRVLLAGVRLPRPETEHVPTDLGPDCGRPMIEGREGTLLSAWCVDRGATTPLVILFHGYAAEKSLLLPEARALLDLGASVLLVDFQGSGGSSGSTTTIGFREADDVAAVTRYARDRWPDRAVILFGQSMGAVAILRAVQTHGVRPDGVVLEAVFDTMLHTVRNRFDAMHVPSFPSAELLVFWGGRQWGFAGFAHNPLDYASALRCPALFLHGTDDPRARPVEGRRVFAAATCPKTFVEFEGVAHRSYVVEHPSKWRATLGAFLAESVPTGG